MATQLITFRPKPRIDLEPLLWLARTLRIKDWIYLLGLPFLALLHSGRETSLPLLERVLGYGALYLCWGYVFNNYFDRGEDSETKNPFLRAIPGLAPFLVAGLSAALVTASIAAVLLYPCLLVMGANAVYSIHPFRLKRFLLPALLLNGLFFSYAYYSAATLAGSAGGGMTEAFSVLVFVVFVAFQGVHWLEHRAEANLEIRWQHRAMISLLFFLPCLTIGAPRWAGSLSNFFPGTLAFALANTASLLTFIDAQKARRVATLMGLIFGLYLCRLADL